ncbi:MAG TPA: hypothetical protein VFG76_06815 [Candidatus Polarisedimenticolia bacterium]|nr:hypothetical protein [Candidatus Polarisedimenticolia bacterium]
MLKVLAERPVLELIVGIGLGCAIHEIRRIRSELNQVTALIEETRDQLIALNVRVDEWSKASEREHEEFREEDERLSSRIRDLERLPERKRRPS